MKEKLFPRNVAKSFFFRVRRFVSYTSFAPSNCRGNKYFSGEYWVQRAGKSPSPSAATGLSVHDTVSSSNRYSRLRKLLLDLITTAKCIHYTCMHEHTCVCTYITRVRVTRDTRVTRVLSIRVSKRRYSIQGVRREIGAKFQNIVHM